MVYTVTDFWSSLKFLLITLARGPPPGWMRRSRSCCQELGSAQLPTLGGMEGPSFATPTTVRCQMTLLCLAISFPCALQKYLFVYLFIYLITWQNFIRINGEVLLGRVRLWLVHSNSVGALQCPWWFSLSSSPHWFSALLYTLILHFTQLSLGFPISSPRFPITLGGEKTALWNFAIYRAGTWHPVSENTFLALQIQITFGVWNNQDSRRGQFDSYIA